MSALHGVLLPAATGGSPLLPVANRPLAVHAVEALAAAGAATITVAADRAGLQEVREALEGALPADVTVAELEVPPGTSEVGTVRLVQARHGGETLLVHRGDALLRADLRALVEAVAQDHADALVLTESHSRSRARIPHNLRGTGRFRRLLRPAGVQVLGPGTASLVAMAEGTTQTLDELAERLADGGVRVREVPVAGSWRYAPGADELLAATRLVLDDVVLSVPEAVAEENEVQGRVQVHPSARVSGSVLRGPVVVGPGAVVRDAFLGSFTSIGAGATIENAELQHTVVMDGAHVSDVGVVLESSVIGPQARVSREFTLPKGLRLDLGPGASVTLS